MVELEVDAETRMIDIDLRDNPDNIACGRNRTESTAISGALTTVFNSIDDTVPSNAGSLRRIRIHLREGCIVGIPRRPYRCSLGRSNICDRLDNGVVRATAELGEGACMAECGPLLLPATGVTSGTDPRTGEICVKESFLFHTAAGASSAADGWLIPTGMGSAGLCLFDSVVLDELRFPSRVYRRGIAVDSEGGGRRRGAPGAHVEFGPVNWTMSIASASDRVVFLAQGVMGGGAAAPAKHFKRDSAGREQELDACAEVRLDAGDVMSSITRPDGGYGPPFGREPERVPEDVAEGWITAARACEIYGAVLDGDGTLDRDATRSVREFSG